MRAQYAGVAAKPMSTDFFAAMIFQHGGNEMKLDVRRRNIGAGSPETTGFCIRRGHDPGTLHPVLQYRPCHAKRAGKRIADQFGGFRFITGNKVDMVFEVRTDLRLVERNFDAFYLTMLRRANAGQLQHLWRSECTGGKDDRALGRLDFPFLAAQNMNDRYAAIFDNQLLDQRIGFAVEIRPTARRFDIGPCRSPEFTAFLGDLVKSDAYLFRAVNIDEDRHLYIAIGFHKGDATGVWPFLVRY